MGQLTKEQVVARSSELAVTTATALSREELNKYEKEHPSELLTPEIRALVEQRCISELILHLNSFVLAAEDSEEEQLSNHFKAWFSENEEARFRLMCVTATRDEIKKHAAPGDENLSYIEKFKRMVAENSKRK